MSDLNVLFVSIDSLRKDMLGAYQSPFEWVEDLGVKTPNLNQFAEKAITFDTHYAGSPCMPARREGDTGIQEFLWRGWGPIEAYDTTLAEKARNAGVLTKLITDHFHLFQHGSGGYYQDYHGFEFIRGHEDDLWKTEPYDANQTLLQQVGYEVDGSQGTTDVDDSDPAANPNHVVDAHDLEQYRPRWKYVRNVDGFDEADETDFFAAKGSPEPLTGSKRTTTGSNGCSGLTSSTFTNRSTVRSHTHRCTRMRLPVIQRSRSGHTMVALIEAKQS